MVFISPYGAAGCLKPGDGRKCNGASSVSAMVAGLQRTPRRNVALQVLCRKKEEQGGDPALPAFEPACPAIKKTLLAGARYFFLDLNPLNRKKMAAAASGTPKYVSIFQLSCTSKSDRSANMRSSR